MRTSRAGTQPGARARRPHLRRGSGIPAAALTAMVLALAAAAPSSSQADTIWGSSLSGVADTVKKATVDSVYWALAIANGTATAPFSGKVNSITVKGHYIGGGFPTILFQVLRPQPDGSLQVVATSAPFTLSTMDGTYTFRPENMFVQQGDHIGVATIGGEFAIASKVTGSITHDFSGHEKDRNGDIIRPTTVEESTEVLIQIDTVPTSPAEPPKKPEQPPKKEEAKNKPCHCEKLSVKVDPTLINRKRLRADKHAFGVGFTWRLKCSEGKGGCKGTIKFMPPKILAGTLPKPKSGLRLNIKVLEFECKAECGKEKPGRFEVKMLSRNQLKALFGRTLAFTLVLTCPEGKAPPPINVKVFVNQHGRLRMRR